MAFQTSLAPRPDEFPRTLALLKSPDASEACDAMRSLLWSLYNSHRPAQLWDAVPDLDAGLRREFAHLIMMSVDEMEPVLKWLLVESGEMERIDTEPTRDEVAWVKAAK